MSSTCPMNKRVLSTVLSAFQIIWRRYLGVRGGHLCRVFDRFQETIPETLSIRADSSRAIVHFDAIISEQLIGVRWSAPILRVDIQVCSGLLIPEGKEIPPGWIQFQVCRSGYPTNRDRA